MKSKRWLLAILSSSLILTAGCTGRKGTQVKRGDHSTYQDHFHDDNGAPHARKGKLLPPPHNHHHGPTW